MKKTGPVATAVFLASAKIASACSGALVFETAAQADYFAENGAAALQTFFEDQGGSRNRSYCPEAQDIVEAFPGIRGVYHRNAAQNAPIPAVPQNSTIATYYIKGSVPGGTFRGETESRGAGATYFGTPVNTARATYWTPDTVRFVAP